MGKGVLDFRNFILSISVNEAEIANPASARFDLLLNKTREFSSAVQSAADASASPSAAPPPKPSAPGIESIGQIKAIDLFLATKSGEGLAQALDQNPDLLSQIVGGENSSDSPDDPEDIWAAVQKNLENRQAYSRNEKAIKEFTGDEKSVIKPEMDLLPSSSPYNYAEEVKKWRGDSKEYDTSEKKWTKVKDFLESEGISVDHEKANLIAVRNYSSHKKGHQNHFTDWVILLSPEDQKKVQIYHATTTPSPFYLPVPFRNWYTASGSKNSVNPKGLAIIQPGSYSYKTGTHKGKHRALVQNGEVTVERYKPITNPNKASFSTFSPGNSERGSFGINIHSVYNNSDPNVPIGAYSAGCIVIQKQKDLDDLLGLLSKYGQSQIKVIVVELDELSREPRKKLEKILASNY